MVANGTATTVSTSGAVAWTRSAPAGGALAAAAATADVCIAFARTDDVLVSCVAPTTGVELWSRSVPGAATSLAAFRDGVGVVLVSAAAGRHVIVASFARTGSVSSQEHAVADLGHTVRRQRRCAECVRVSAGSDAEFVMVCALGAVWRRPKSRFGSSARRVLAA